MFFCARIDACKHGRANVTMSARRGTCSRACTICLWLYLLSRTHATVPKHEMPPPHLATIRISLAPKVSTAACPIRPHATNALVGLSDCPPNRPSACVCALPAPLAGHNPKPSFPRPGCKLGPSALRSPETQRPTNPKIRGLQTQELPGPPALEAGGVLKLLYLAGPTLKLL